MAVALLALCAGGVLAWHHPLGSVPATMAFVVWTLIAVRCRDAWSFAVPAAMPVLNLSPWSGWLTFDEFDLLVLGIVAGGHARLALDHATRSAGSGPPPHTPRFTSNEALVLAFGTLGLVALLRGIADAGGWTFGWFDGYAEPANSVRVFKSTVYALAFWPLIRDALQRSPRRTLQRFANGMQVGLAIVGLAVLWERVAYPGLLNFSKVYRATALFWEMHVGGGAIDAYLALAAPFAAWAVWSARSGRQWLAAALLALLTLHACLTTFSRGVYLGVAAPLLLLGITWWVHRLASDSRAAGLGLASSLSAITAAAAVLIVGLATSGHLGLLIALTGLMALVLALRLGFPTLHWRRTAMMVLTLALMTEAVAVIGGGSFARSRVNASPRDLSARLLHWQHGLGLPNGATDWLLGIGLGRLPAETARLVPGERFSGSVRSVPTGDGRFVARLSGPTDDLRLGGLFTLTQRVPLVAGGTYRVAVIARSNAPAYLALEVCEEHLLYARRCQSDLVQVRQDAAWQTIDAPLHGPALSSGPTYAPRLGVLSLSVLDANATVELAQVDLTSPDGRHLLRNVDFAASLAHWLPVAHRYFLPWHIDSLYLELLLERGVLGLSVFLLLACRAFRELREATIGWPMAPFLAASLLGAMLVGGLSSILDAPRVAFLLLMVLTISLQLRAPAGVAPGSRLSPSDRPSPSARRFAP